jgi:hypothetical protein
MCDTSTHTRVANFDVGNLSAPAIFLGVFARIRAVGRDAADMSMINQVSERPGVPSDASFQLEGSAR